MHCRTRSKVLPYSVRPPQITSGMAGTCSMSDIGITTCTSVEKAITQTRANSETRGFVARL